MKLKIYFLALSFLLSVQLASAEEADPSDRFNLIGAGVAVSASPYDGDDAHVWGVPIGFWRNEHFFVEGLKGGWIFAENDAFRADLFLTPRLMGYDADNSSALNGMSNRDFSIDGGAQITWKVPDVKDLTLNLSATTDLMSKHEGQEIALSGQKVFKFDFYQIVPEIGFKWQSSNLVDYYYGVRDSEATANRPAYEPDAAIDPFINVGFYMGLSQEWFLVSRFGYEFLGNEIQDSPIVDKSGLFTGVIGLAKRF